MSCKLENVVADGTVCGDAEVIDGRLVAHTWREVTVEDFFCECGEYFDTYGLIEHLKLEVDNG